MCYKSLLFCSFAVRIWHEASSHIYWGPWIASVAVSLLKILSLKVTGLSEETMCSNLFLVFMAGVHCKNSAFGDNGVRCLKLYNVSPNITIASFRVNVLVGPFWKPYIRQTVGSKWDMTLRQSYPSYTTSRLVPTLYGASILFGHEEAGTWARLASPAVSREQDRVQIKCWSCISQP
jgi:hypothetical protein